MLADPEIDADTLLAARLRSIGYATADAMLRNMWVSSIASREIVVVVLQNSHNVQTRQLWAEACGGVKG